MKKNVIYLKNFIEKKLKKSESVLNFENLKNHNKIFYEILIAWNSTIMLEKVIESGNKATSPYSKSKCVSRIY